MSPTCGIREMRAIQIVAYTYTIMTQFTSKKSCARRRTRELSRSVTGDRIESRYIIIESMVSRNAVDETSILENHEIFIANWHIRILRSSLSLRMFSYISCFFLYSCYLLAEFAIDFS